MSKLKKTKLYSGTNTNRTAQKYNKVNQQKKFHLLTLIYHQRLTVQQVELFRSRLPRLWELTVSLPKPSSFYTKINTNPISSPLSMPTILTILYTERTIPMPGDFSFIKSKAAINRIFKSFAQSAVLGLSQIDLQVKLWCDHRCNRCT